MSLQIFGTPGAVYVRRRKGEEYHPDCVVPTVKFGGGSCMVWGCMAAGGIGELFTCEGRMNSDSYIDVLGTSLKASYRKIFGNRSHRRIIFQQDNAPCHKSRKTMEWFSNQNIQVLEWPAQSPDLNPIEHLWALLKKRIKNNNPTSLVGLKSAIRREWEKISSEECFNLVASMPRRVLAVIKANGGPTNY